MKNKIDYKMALYTLVIALACVLLRKFIAPSIPTMFSLSIAGILLLMGLIISLVEIKNNLDLFYSYANNWNGHGILNSGFVIGVANYFLSINSIYGTLSAFLLSIAVIVVRKGLRSVFA